MYIIRKCTPEPGEDRLRYCRDGKVNGIIWCTEPEAATQYPTKKLAMDMLNLIKLYGVDYEIVSLEEVLNGGGESTRPL